MNPRQIAGCCLVLLLACLPGADAVAVQIASPNAPNGAPDATPPSTEGIEPPSAEETGPIPPAEISSQATEAVVRLQQIEDIVAASPALATLALDFTQQTQRLARLQMELTSLAAARATARQLENERAEWTRLSEQIDRWLKLTDERWRELQEKRDELRRMQQRWEATLESATDEELPAELKQRVEQILRRVDSVQGQTRSRIDSVAEFLERLSDARETTSEALRQLVALTERVNRQLLVRDAQPLWQTPPLAWRGLEITSVSSWQAWWYELLRFATENAVRVLVHLSILAILLIASLWARKSSRSWPDNQAGLARARFVLSRPFAVALLLAVLVGALIYGTVPSVARDFFYFLVMLPVLRLAPGLASRGERVGLYGLVGLLVLFQFAQLSPRDSLILRVVLLVLDGVAISLLVAAVWSAEAWRRRGWSGRSGLVLLACMVLLPLMVAFASNLLGWVSLAKFLTESTVLTCQAALLALILLRAGGALWVATVRCQPGRVLLSCRRYPELYEKAGFWLLGLALFYEWIRQTLRRFRLTELVDERIEQLRSAPLSWADIEITAGDVMQAGLILTGTFLAQRLMSFLLREELFPRLQLRTSSTAVFATLLKYAIVTAGLALTGAALGFTATQLTVLFGALGVGIGFGLQTIVNNFVSGLILLFERPINIGDVLEANGTWSVVKRIGVRATVLQTFDGAELVVPNGDLISKEVKNWTLSNDLSRLDVFVGTSYKSDPREVLAVLHRVAREHELVLSEPEPMVWMLGFGDSSMNFRLLCWTRIEQRPEVASQLYVAVHKELAESGIEIPFPQRDLHLRSVDASAALPSQLTRSYSPVRPSATMAKSQVNSESSSQENQP